MRKVPSQTGEFYHIYNRGVDKREIFLDDRDFVRFLTSLREFNNESGDAQRDYLKRQLAGKSDFGYPKSDFNSAEKLASVLADLPKLVEIICYCLNPNHYHFILKQLEENGISKFMQKLDIGYTKYFNKKNNRTGSLFESKFKSAHLKTDDQLFWTSGYVNGNSEIHKIAKAADYKWCSYPDYLNKRPGTLCNKQIILNQFKDIIRYQEFVGLVIKECQGRKEMQKLILE